MRLNFAMADVSYFFTAELSRQGGIKQSSFQKQLTSAIADLVKY